MSTFLYEAFDADGKSIHGQFEADTKQGVVEYLIHHALSPVKIDDLAHSSAKGKLSTTFFESVSPTDVLFLVRNLATTIKAGMSIVESLDVLIADSEKPLMRRILEGVQGSIKSGQPLSQAFEPYKNWFPVAFIGMIKAGEISGKLDSTLTTLGQYLTREFQLRGQVRSALIYPIVLLVASIGVTALLLIGVLPRLTSAFASSGVQLPLITKIFLAMSNALTWSFTLDGLVVVGLAWFFIYFRRTPRGKIIWNATLSRLPIARNIMHKIALVRFTRTFGSLMDSGISALEGLEITAQSIGNDEYERVLRAGEKQMQEGVSISHTLAEHPKLFPRVLTSLVVVGEKTGTLSMILLSLADFYEEEVSSELKDMVAILEPVLLLVMGLVVGAIALSILLPIYQMVGGVH